MPSLPVRHAPVVIPADEAEWPARIREGDAAAFEAMFRRYYDGLWRFALGYVGTRAVAEELVQDVMLQIWARRTQWVIRGGVKTYLYSAVRNCALNAERSVRTRRRFEEGTAADDVPPGMGEPSADVAAHVVDAERNAAIRRAIAKLPERRRLVLTLRWDHGMTYSEIAAVAGISVHAAEVSASRSFAVLREVLAHFR